MTNPILNTTEAEDIASGMFVTPLSAEAFTGLSEEAVEKFAECSELVMSRCKDIYQCVVVNDSIKLVEHLYGLNDVVNDLTDYAKSGALNGSAEILSFVNELARSCVAMLFALAPAPVVDAVAEGAH